MPAYVISETQTLDEERAGTYRQLAAASIEQYGGRYLARGRLPEAVEGSWPEARRMVIIEFASMAEARRWYDSPEYTEALKAGRDALDRRLLFIEGGTQ